MTSGAFQLRTAGLAPTDLTPILANAAPTDFDAALLTGQQVEMGEPVGNGSLNCHGIDPLLRHWRRRSAATA